MTATQVCDWLKEHYRENIKERTVSQYSKVAFFCHNIVDVPRKTEINTKNINTYNIQALRL